MPSLTKIYEERNVHIRFFFNFNRKIESPYYKDLPYKRFLYKFFHNFLQQKNIWVTGSQEHRLKAVKSLKLLTINH